MGDRFVYVIGTPDGPVKIGVANNVERRLGAIQSGNERKLSILFKMPVPSDRAHEVERRAHNHLRECHVLGEWFSVGSDRAVSVVKSSATEGSVPAPRSVGGRGRPKLVGREPHSTYVLRVPKAVHLELKEIAGPGKVAAFVRKAIEDATRRRERGK